MKKINTRKYCAVLLWSLIIVILPSCQKQSKNDKNVSEKMALEEVSDVSELHNGDAKFFGNNIITSVNGKLTMYDVQGNLVRTYNDIDANWIACSWEEKLIIYGNGNQEVGLVQLSEENDVVNKNTIFQGSLCIDPTIMKINGQYYVTFTEIIGNVNNADPQAENGEYIIQLYCSSDLKKWDKVCDILDEKHNLEDADIFYYADHFYLCYEQEEVDKGNSSIMLIRSKDQTGKEWDSPVQLLKPDCDHEPATVTNIKKDGFRLYYSSDKRNPGASYNEADIYYADFDYRGGIQGIEQQVQTKTEKGILLYDVENINDKLYFLCAGNYLTDADMIVEKQK